MEPPARLGGRASYDREQIMHRETTTRLSCQLALCASPLEAEATEGGSAQIAQQPETAAAYEIVIITPGAGNGYEWPAEVLAGGAPLFESATSFTNHEREDVRANRPGGRALDDICGVVYDARWDATRQAILATWRASGPRGPWTASMIEQLLQDREAGLPVPDVGISADLTFTHRNQRATRLVKVHSVDVVWNAARGPHYAQAFARIANSVHHHHSHCSPPEGEENTLMEPDEVTTIVETEQLATPAPPGPPLPAPAPAPTTTPGSPVPSSPVPSSPAIQGGAWETGARAMLAGMAQAFVEATLRAASLPPVAAERVRGQFAGQTIVEPAALEAAIQGERDYLAALGENGVIRGMGAESGPHG
ncbi:MAG: hypothetical protein ACRDIB_03150, partial [Ardenticatenaceae bacterium]